VWRASRREPCPICDRAESCSRSERGVYFCLVGRSNMPGFCYLGETKDGQWAKFVPDDGERGAEEFRRRELTPPPKAIVTPPDFARIIAQYPCPPEQLIVLESRLGIPAQFLQPVYVGYVPTSSRDAEGYGEHWFSAEYDARGNVLGL